MRFKDSHEMYICTFLQSLYDGKWHQLKLLVRQREVTAFLDDQLTQEVTLKPVEPIYINGETQVAKARGSGVTVPVSTNTCAHTCKDHDHDTHIHTEHQ